MYALSLMFFSFHNLKPRRVENQVQEDAKGADKGKRGYGVDHKNVRGANRKRFPPAIALCPLRTEVRRPTAEALTVAVI